MERASLKGTTISAVDLSAVSPAAAGLRAAVALQLSAGERHRYRTLDAQRGIDFLAGRVALKAALRRALGAAAPDPAAIAVENAPDGRPRLPGWPSLRCSLAHGGGYGLGAVATQPVGVDVERVRPRDPRLLRLVATADERAAADDGLGPDRLLVRLWTAKEAVLKGLGVGLALAPRRLALRRVAEHAYAIDVQANVPSAVSSWWVWSYDVADLGVALAIIPPAKEATRERPRIDWHRTSDVRRTADPPHAVRARSPWPTRFAVPSPCRLRLRGLSPP